MHSDTDQQPAGSSPSGDHVDAVARAAARMLVGVHRGSQETAEGWIAELVATMQLTVDDIAARRVSEALMHASAVRRLGRSLVGMRHLLPGGDHDSHQAAEELDVALDQFDDTVLTDLAADARRPCDAQSVRAAALADGRSSAARVQAILLSHGDVHVAAEALHGRGPHTRPQMDAIRGRYTPTVTALLWLTWLRVRDTPHGHDIDTSQIRRDAARLDGLPDASHQLVVRLVGEFDGTAGELLDVASYLASDLASSD